MPAKIAKTTKNRYRRPIVRPLLDHLFSCLAFASLAASFGAVGAYATASAAPEATARLIGPLYCPATATPGITTRYDVVFRDWENRLWQLPMPAFECTSARGRPVALTHAGFSAAWFGAWIAGAAGMTGLLYGMWALTSSLAQAPATHTGAQPLEPFEDLPAQFLAECCEVAPKQRAPAAQLHAAYAAWTRAKGHRPPASKALAREWKRLGLRQRRFFGYNVWRGARLKM